jgi:VanZ family protein
MARWQAGSAGSGTGLSFGRVWGPPCAVAALILILSSTPGAYFPEHSPLSNNFVHFFEFGLLSFVLTRALNYVYSLTKIRLFLWATFICGVFGILDEAHQFLVPERMFDLKDLLYDLAGAMLGALCYVLLIALKTGGTGESRVYADETDD